MLFHRKSLATRASLAVFFLSLVVVILVSFWQLLAEYRKELRQVEQQMVSLEISVANVVSRSLWMYDEEQLQTMLRGLHTLPYVNYARIESVDGLLIEEGQRPDDKVVRSIDIFAPNSPMTPIGSLSIESDRDAVRVDVFRRIQSIFWSNFVLIMLISGITILIFQLQVSRPLIALSQHASQIQMNSLGDVIDPAKLAEEHELGQVYRAIDTMQRNIRSDFQTILQAEAEVESYKQNLERLVEERTEKLIQTTKDLVDTSRRAGMAEVAIGVLHNIGNALTGANVKVQNLNDIFQNEDSVVHLRNLVELLREQGESLPDFLRHDERGAKILPFLEAVTAELSQQNENVRNSVALLRKDLGNVSQIISKQQSHAKFTGLVENLLYAECIEDVLSLRSFEIDRFKVIVQKFYQTGITLSTDRHKLLQIIINLISNAVQAMQQNTGSRVLTLRLQRIGERILFSVQDNGIGISEEEMQQIFRYGYTTKKTGHGFGLHSCSLDAKLMGGQLSCSSDGRNKGATFVLDLPTVLPTRPLYSDVYAADS